MKMKKQNKDYCPLIEEKLEKALNNSSVAVTVTAEYKEECFDVSINASFKADDIQGDYEKPGSTVDNFAAEFVMACRKCILPVGDKWYFTLSFDLKEDTSIKAPSKVRLEYTRKTDSWSLSKVNN